MDLYLSSTAFDYSAAIPKRHTGEGEDLSPPLSWHGVPAGTRELALVVDDPDAPTPEPWVHWVIYKIPANQTGLSEGISKNPRLGEPAGALQGRNSWNTIGYRGPLPPKGHGTHHYHFKLYALDLSLTIQPGATKEELLKLIKGHVIAEGELVGTYTRS